MSDTPYSGIFIRDALTQTPLSPPPGFWSVSPDVIVSGPTVLDWSGLTTDVGYAQTYNVPLNGYPPLAQDKVNYAWIRAIGTSASIGAGRVWLYLAESSMLPYPSAWISDGIRVGDALANYQPIKPIGGSGSVNYMVTPQPFMIDPPPFLTSSDNWALVALVENQPSDPPVSPLLALNDFGTVGALAQWVVRNPTVGFISTQASPDRTLTKSLTRVKGPGTFGIGYACANFTPSSSANFNVTVSLVGPDFANTVNLSDTVTSASQQNSKTVTLPTGFSGYVALSVTGDQPMPANASARALVIPS